LRTLDLTLGWLLIAFGAVHISLTRSVHPEIDINAIWFICGGLLMIAIGALDLLRVAYGPVAKGVGVVSAIANVVFLLLMVLIATRVPMRNNPQVVIGLVLAALLTACSVLRRAGRRAIPST
jgi:peptidoglycan/LPS O-acetylase OafA/YrhL